MKNISAFCIILCAFLGHSQTDKSAVKALDSAFRTQFVFLERTLNNTIEKRDFPVQMRDNFTSGEYLIKWNQQEMAVEYFKTVLRGSRFINDKTLIIQSRIHLATIYQQLGERSKAKYHIKKGLETIKKDSLFSFEPALSIPHYLVTASYGPSEEADKLYRDVLKLNVAPNSTKNLPDVYFQRAINHKSEFDSLIQIARVQYAAEGDHNGIGHCINAMADSHETTDINRTIELSLEALKHFIIARNNPEILVSRQKLASLYLQANKETAASEQLSEISALANQMTGSNYFGDSISRRNTQIKEIQGSLVIDRLQKEQEKTQFKTFWSWAIISGFLALFATLLYIQRQRDKKAM